MICERINPWFVKEMIHVLCCFEFFLFVILLSYSPQTFRGCLGLPSSLVFSFRWCSTAPVLQLPSLRLWPTQINPLLNSLRWGTHPPTCLPNYNVPNSQIHLNLSQINCDTATYDHSDPCLICFQLHLPNSCLLNWINVTMKWDVFFYWSLLSLPSLNLVIKDH